MDIENILVNALREPKDAIRYTLSKALVECYADLAMLETSDGGFNLHSFAYEGQCKVSAMSPPHPEGVTHWSPRGLYEDWINAFREVEWQGTTFTVVTISYMGMRYGDEVRHYILGPSEKRVREFFSAVCRWNNEVRGEILVYHGSCWSKSTELFEAIRDARYEDVILARNMLDDIRADFERFLSRKEIYEKHRIPWKRGVLFLGPPGNGKTQMVKAVANGLGIPVLYVRSLKSEYGTEHDSIRNVFHRARESAPCLLVLEDIDSLIDADNRSFFLNEMDGFSANTGLITLATANYPEKLDPAILDRPSRFDRKYHFELPELEERRRYIAKWNESLERDLQIPSEDVDKIAAETHEFSFAYIKELFLSGMMQWIDENKSRKMGDVLSSLVEPLKQQMKSALAAPPPEPDEDEDSRSAMMRRMGMPPPPRRRRR
jgi:hypothetical protein